MSGLLSEEQEQKLINEEYKTWKKNSAFLYDIILSSALEWPSLTCEWLPNNNNNINIENNNNNNENNNNNNNNNNSIKDDIINYNIEKIILGTHTNNTELNYLLICEVKIPTLNINELQSKYLDSSDIYGGYGGSSGKIEIIQRIIHKGEVNRARYMPQLNNIIATKTKYSDIHIFNINKHTYKPIGNISKPNIILKGHIKEGYGIDWNIYNNGLLLSGSDDKKILIWDINKIKNNNNNTNHNYHYIFNKHTDRVEDVQWHKFNKKIFGSVSDDKTLRIFDYTLNNNEAQIHLIKDAHKGEINCISFSPFNENLLLTGGADKYVALWDLRNLSQKVCFFCEFFFFFFFFYPCTKT